MSGERSTSGSFWHSVPGVVTAVAGLIAAIGTLIGTVYAINSGGDGDSSPPPTPSPTMTISLVEWRAEASSICGRYLPELLELDREFDIDEAEASLVRYADVLQDMHDETAALTRPGRARDDIARYLQTLQAEATTTRFASGELGRLAREPTQENKDLANEALDDFDEAGDKSLERRLALGIDC